MELISCPIKNRKIREYECYEISMAAEGLAPSSYISSNKLELEELIKICLECSNHRDD